jgi:hypothetical protein
LSGVRRRVNRSSRRSSRLLAPAPRPRKWIGPSPRGENTPLISHYIICLRVTKRYVRTTRSLGLFVHVCRALTPGRSNQCSCCFLSVVFVSCPCLRESPLNRGLRYMETVCT